MRRCVLLSAALVLGFGLALALVAGLGALSVRADPGVLFVKPDGAGTACTQANPCDLQTALAQASEGDTLYLAQGVYKGTGGAVITITKSITLYGGWNGAASGPVVRDPATCPTTLDGEGERRVVGMRGSTLITVTLEGLTLTNGFAADQGAGFYARDVALTLRNTTVYSNVANSRGTSNTQGGGGYILGGSWPSSHPRSLSTAPAAMGAAAPRAGACGTRPIQRRWTTACFKPTTPGKAAGLRLMGRLAMRLSSFARPRFGTTASALARAAM